MKFTIFHFNGKPEATNCLPRALRAFEFAEQCCAKLKRRKRASDHFIILRKKRLNTQADRHLQYVRIIIYLLRARDGPIAGEIGLALLSTSATNRRAESPPAPRGRSQASLPLRYRSAVSTRQPNRAGHVGVIVSGIILCEMVRGLHLRCVTSRKLQIKL